MFCAWASRKLDRPIKWVATRSDDMATMHHGRDQIAYTRMGARRDGKITAFHVRIIADLGAYNMLLTPSIPSLGAFVMSGVYDIPAVHTDIVGVFTNKFATDAIRGAGRPEATHMIEVTIDQLAHELGMDPLELRRRNFIPPHTEPHETAVGVSYDSGNHQATLDKLLEHIDVQGFRAEQERLRQQGVYRGLGFCTYTVFSGTSPHGQGHETGFAQIVADRLGVDPQQVEVLHGDTSAGPEGLNTYGSRSLAVGGEAVARTAEKGAAKAKAIVPHPLEAAPEDIEVRDGKFMVRGSPDKAMTLAEVAGEAYIPLNLPEGMEPGLEEVTFYDPENFVFPFGAHACVVELDPDTGKVKVIRYIAVDDCGPAINPLLIDGQVHGGIVHSIGQALYEQVVYDEAGQLVTGTFVDYALPTAAEIPTFETDRTETPSPVNSLGVKGVGEAGTTAGTATIVNAVIDALRPLGLSYLNMPLS